VYVTFADPSSASLPRSHRPVTRPYFGVDSIVESGGIAEDYLYDDDEDEYYEEDGEEYYGVDEYYDGLDFGESALVLDRDRVSAPINDRTPSRRAFQRLDRYTDARPLLAIMLPRSPSLHNDDNAAAAATASTTFAPHNRHAFTLWLWNNPLLWLWLL
jgi:hypothetical protein